MSQSITVMVGATPTEVTLPDVFQAMSDILPIVLQYFGDTKVEAVLATDLWKQVGGTYKKQAWIDKVVKHCHLVEGEDYTVFIMDVNDPANAAEVARNRGVAPTLVYFTPCAATHILATAGTLEAKKLHRFMYWVANAATPVLLKQLEKAKAEALLEKSKAAHANNLLEENTDAMNKLGTNSAEVVEASKKAEQLPLVRAQLGQANNAAKVFWETCSTALSRLKNGKVNEARNELEYALQPYGMFVDELNETFPWCD